MIHSRSPFPKTLATVGQYCAIRESSPTEGGFPVHSMPFLLPDRRYAVQALGKP